MTLLRKPYPAEGGCTAHPGRDLPTTAGLDRQIANEKAQVHPQMLLVRSRPTGVWEVGPPPLWLSGH